MFVSQLVDTHQIRQGGRRVKAGDEVLIMESTRPRAKWKRGVVEAFKPSHDKQKRRCVIKIEGEEIEQAPSKL